MRQDLAAGFRHDDILLDLVDPVVADHRGFDREDHARLEDGLIADGDVRRLRAQEAQGVAKAEIERFVVAEYDNHIIGCAALYAFPEEHTGELAALAVNPDYRREGYGEALMREIEQRARWLRLSSLFVLTTRTAHWFLERGFRAAAISELPLQKQALYNYQRKSLVYVKQL